VSLNDRGFDIKVVDGLPCGKSAFIVLC